MTNVKWILQDNFIDDQRYNDFKLAINNNANSEYIPVKVTPFIDDINLEVTNCDLKNFVTYGSTKLTKIAINKKWKGVFFNDNFDVRVWVNKRDDMLNNNCLFMTIGECKGWNSVFYDEDPIFVRPCLDLKAFNGTLTTIGQLKKWVNEPQSSNHSFNDETVIAISPPKSIDIEYRWFVVDKKVISGSVYKVNGQVITLEEARPNMIKIAQDLADKWLPHSTCVMDVALINNEYKIIEFNCFNSSGFYKHNLDKIVDAVNKMIMKESLDDEEACAT